MILLDTNLWIYGFVRDEPKALDLIDQIVEGRSVTAFDAYSVLEFMDRMEALKRRGEQQNVVDGAQNDFYQLMTTAPTVETYPAQHELSSTSLADVRRDPCVQLVATLTSVQPKDVPFVKLAHEYKEMDPTIYTADEAFSAFDPAASGLGGIGMVHVSV